MGNHHFLKVLACVFMFIDHVGAFLYPDLLYLRGLGRLAFPIFAYLIVDGFFHTHDLKKYAFRLFALASLWQIPTAFFILHGDFAPSEPINVIFTLFVGLYCIYLLDNEDFKTLFLVLITSIIFDYFHIGLQYGTYGLAIIISCYCVRYEDYKFIYLFGITFILSFLMYALRIYPFYQVLSSFAFIIISFPLYYDIKLPRFTFYVFYPLHIFALMFIKYI